MFGFERKVSSAFALVAIAALAGCHRGGEGFETQTGALTSAEVLGFESVSGWTRTQGTVQSIALTTNRTKGAQALAVTKPSGNVRIESAKLASTTPTSRRSSVARTPRWTS